MSMSFDILYASIQSSREQLIIFFKVMLINVEKKITNLIEVVIFLMNAMR